MGPALAVLSHVKNGRVRAFAITSTSRARAVPDLPTAAEAGLRGMPAR